MAADPADPRRVFDPAELAGLSLAAAVRRLAAGFTRAGIAGGDRDARILIAAALGIDGARLLIEPERVLGAADANRITALADRRAAREPVSRILGWREFYGRRFQITPATLDPRPDSETLIETALEIARARGWTARPIDILDIGTGSGCLLVTLLAELATARGIGVDISHDALGVARVNATSAGVGDRARWVCGDGAGAVGGRFDLIVANPPYIPCGAIAVLDAEVHAFDPRAALDGGADGLAFFLAWAHDLFRLGANDGAVILEIGHDQSATVTAILRDACPLGIEPHLRIVPDLNGQTRCVAIEAQRSS